MGLGKCPENMSSLGRPTLEKKVVHILLYRDFCGFDQAKINLFVLKMSKHNQKYLKT